MTELTPMVIIDIPEGAENEQPRRNRLHRSGMKTSLIIIGIVMVIGLLLFGGWEVGSSSAQGKSRAIRALKDDPAATKPAIRCSERIRNRKAGQIATSTPPSNVADEPVLRVKGMKRRGPEDMEVEKKKQRLAEERCEEEERTKAAKEHREEMRRKAQEQREERRQKALEHREEMRQKAQEQREEMRQKAQEQREEKEAEKEEQDEKEREEKEAEKEEQEEQDEKEREEKEAEKEEQEEEDEKDEEEGEDENDDDSEEDKKPGSRLASAASTTVNPSRLPSFARWLIEPQHECQWKKEKGCEERFAKRRQLVAHMREKHDPERPFKCQHCEYKDKSQSKLDRHMGSMHPDAPSDKVMMECLWGCGQSFYSGKKLVEHMREKHDKINPYKCPYPQCDYKTSMVSSLQEHLPKHTGGPAHPNNKKRQEKRRSNLLRSFNFSFDNQRLIKLIKGICQKKDEAVYQKSKLKLLDEEDKALSGAVYALFEAEEGFDPSKASGGAILVRTHYIGKTENLLTRLLGHRSDTMSQKKKEKLSVKHKFLLDVASGKKRGFATWVFLPLEAVWIGESACIRYWSGKENSHVNQRPEYNIGTTPAEDTQIAKLVFEGMAVRVREGVKELADLNALMTYQPHKEILPAAFVEGNEEDGEEQTDEQEDTELEDGEEEAEDEEDTELEDGEEEAEDEEDTELEDDEDEAEDEHLAETRDQPTTSWAHQINFFYDVEEVVKTIKETCEESEHFPKRNLKGIEEADVDLWGAVYVAFEPESTSSLATATGEDIMKGSHYIGKVDKRRAIKNGKIIPSILERWLRHRDRYVQNQKDDKKRTSAREQFMASVKNGDKIGYVTWLYLPKEAARIAEGVLIRHCKQSSNCPHVGQQREALYSFTSETDAHISELVFAGMAERVRQGPSKLLDLQALMKHRPYAEILPDSDI